MASDTAGFIHTAATLTMRTRFFFEEIMFIDQFRHRGCATLRPKVALIMSGWTAVRITASRGPVDISQQQTCGNTGLALMILM